MLLIPGQRNLSVFKQFFASIVGLMLHVSLGICQGFSAVLIPQLQSVDSKLPITTEDASWIASVCVVSMPMGALFVGVLVEAYGRKRIIQAAFLPLVIGWALIASSQSILMICVGRFITGFAIAMDPAVVIYIAETNTPKYRSILLSLTGPSVLTGTLTSYLLGHYLEWRMAAGVLSLFSFGCFCILFSIPESPVWLISKDNIKAATESLKWLRNETTAVNAELEQLLQAKLTTDQTLANDSFVRKVIKTKAWKPFLILTFYFLLTQCCGFQIILYYGVNFYDAFGAPIDGFSSSLIYIGLSLFFSFVFTATVESAGRKTLTIISAAGVCVTYLSAAAYGYLTQDVHEKPTPWLPLVCLWLSVAFATIGMNPLPWLMSGELFPAGVRGVMTGALWVTVYFYIFLAVKIYPLVVPFLGVHGVLGVFSASAFVAVLFGVFVVPETKGKTLIEIEKSW